MATTTTMTPRREQREAAPERAGRTVSPRVDIYETDNSFVLLADMPGVAADGLEVEAEGETLVIRGRVTRPEPPADYQEFELADYERAFILTQDLETEGIKATLRDGMLRVEIPKSPRLQPKKIPVRTE
jgi:HSP20 family molecular chaperone IbpA